MRIELFSSLSAKEIYIFLIMIHIANIGKYLTHGIYFNFFIQEHAQLPPDKCSPESVVAIQDLATTTRILKGMSYNENMNMRSRLRGQTKDQKRLEKLQNLDPSMRAIYHTFFFILSTCIHDHHHQLIFF